MDLIKARISFFSEGNMYHSTFKPLIESFLKKKIKVIYYTLDAKDEILNIKNEFLETKYLGFKLLSIFKFSLISSDYMFCTTPNIGTNGYPYRKPRLVKNLIHVFHSVSDISIYRKGSLDFYDKVILAGEFQTESIKKLENLRHLNQKELLPLGVPYLDFLLKNKENKIKKKGKTILIGSSWGNKGCLRKYGTDFIVKLAIQGYNIIVRPHPYSYHHENSFLKIIRKKLNNYKNIFWDDSISPIVSLNEADLLISDTSSLRFDFFLVYEKPVITLDIKSDEMKGYEREFLGKNWTDRCSYEIGPVINKNTLKSLDFYVQKLLTEFSCKEVKEYRNKLLYNFGKSADSIANYFYNLKI